MTQHEILMHIMIGTKMRTEVLSRRWLYPIFIVNALWL